MQTIRTTRKVQLNGNSRSVWFAYNNGEMLRDRRGIGRRFLSEQAAMEAA